MKPRILGMLLIGLGIIMMVYTGFSYSSRDKVAEIGPVNITATRNHPVSWSPIIGVILIVGGIVIVAVTRKDRI